MTAASRHSALLAACAAAAKSTATASPEQLPATAFAPKGDRSQTTRDRKSFRKLWPGAGKRTPTALRYACNQFRQDVTSSKLFLYLRDTLDLIDQSSLGISRKRMSVLAMVPFNVVTAMSTTCSDLGGSKNT